jgi:hypothetical protein
MRCCSQSRRAYDVACADSRVADVLPEWSGQQQLGGTVDSSHVRVEGRIVGRPGGPTCPLSQQFHVTDDRKLF